MTAEAHAAADGGQTRAIIVGAAGFVGGHLAAHLQNTLGWRVAATKLPQEAINFPCGAVYDVDILQPGQLEAVLEAEQPGFLFHLAAQSSVGLSWKNPALTVEVNVVGTLNVLDALRAHGRPVRALLPGSSEEYGRLRPQEIPVKEDTLPRPGNVYAVTKNVQNQLARVYAEAYGLPLVCTRSFNHIGPGQAPGFVLPDFCKQVAAIEAGLAPPVMKVGNLDAKRDFCDVRDIVAAYAALVQRGAPGETYNVGSGKSVPVRHLLDVLLGLATVPITVEPDPARMRPSDVPDVRADIAKVRAAVGWAPAFSIEETIRETLDEWRAKTAAG